MVGESDTIRSIAMVWLDTMFYYRNDPEPFGGEEEGRRPDYEIASGEQPGGVSGNRPLLIPSPGSHKNFKTSICLDLKFED